MIVKLENILFVHGTEKLGRTKLWESLEPGYTHFYPLFLLLFFLFLPFLFSSSPFFSSSSFCSFSFLSSFLLLLWSPSPPFLFPSLFLLLFILPQLSHAEYMSWESFSTGWQRWPLPASCLADRIGFIYLIKSLTLTPVSLTAL